MSGSFYVTTSAGACSRKKHLRSRDNNIKNEGLIKNVQVGGPFSYHTNSIAFEVKSSSSKNPSHKKVYKFTKANLDRLNELFNFVPWTCAFLTDDV